MHMGNSPIGVIGDIEKSRTLEELAGLRRKIDNVREMLLRQGGSIKNLVALISELNDRVTLRLLTLTRQAMQREGLGGPPSTYCWISMGSEGRLEQTLRTDQDNAIAFGEDTAADVELCKKWFLDYSERVVDGLARYGFPRCTGGFMASNPQWCGTYTFWERTFMSWVQAPSPAALRLATVFFDFRPLYAESRFPEALRDGLHKAIRDSPFFLRSMAKNALYNIPPLGFFRTFVVEKSGEHKNGLNLKLKGLTPVVDAARVLALDLNINATNTLERLAAAHDSNIVDGELYADLQEAYGFIFHLRISKHLEARSKGQVPDNFIDPAGLNNLQRKMLKESFAAINRLQEMIQFRYQTQLIPGD
jgi:CBS domain-containing protein